MVASENGHVEVVNMLLQHGARVDLQNKVQYFLGKVSPSLNLDFFIV